MKMMIFLITVLVSIGGANSQASDLDLAGQCGKVDNIKDRLSRRGEIIVSLSESYSFSILQGKYRLSENPTGRGDKQVYSITPSLDFLNSGESRELLLQIYKNTITDLLRIAQATGDYACITVSYDCRVPPNRRQYRPT